MPRDTPGVIAPPPLIFGGFLVLGFLLDALAGDPGIRLTWWLRWLLAALLLYPAARLLIGAMRALRQAGTPVEPWKPTSALVTSGVFARSRNPIYLAMTLAFAAIVLAFDSIFGVLLLPAVVATIQYGVIAREEPYLEARFGDEYRRYKDSVRAWI